MKSVQPHPYFACLVLSVIVAIGCSKPEGASMTGAISPAKSPGAVTAAAKVPLERVSTRPGNKNGAVFVAEYHHIKTGKTTMERPVEAFKADLERLYKDGFRPVTVSQYLENKMPLPPGASPVVFTFDDANPTQFKILDDGSIDPNCAVGIWKAFAEKHPDFPIHATFYILPSLWGQPKMVDKKMAMLREWGSELGDHTLSHPNLKKLSDEDVKKELAGGADLCLKNGEKDPVSMALPLGVFPQNRELVKGFTYNGKQYHLKAAMLVGANPALAPTDPKFDPYRVARIQATVGAMGLDYWLDALEKGQVKPYVEP